MGLQVSHVPTPALTLAYSIAAEKSERFHKDKRTSLSKNLRNFQFGKKIEAELNRRAGNTGSAVSSSSDESSDDDGDTDYETVSQSTPTGFSLESHSISVSVSHSTDQDQNPHSNNGVMEDVTNVPETEGNVGMERTKKPSLKRSRSSPTLSTMLLTTLCLLLVFAVSVNAQIDCSGGNYCFGEPQNCDSNTDCRVLIHFDSNGTLSIYLRNFTDVSGYAAISVEYLITAPDDSIHYFCIPHQGQLIRATDNFDGTFLVLERKFNGVVEKLDENYFRCLFNISYDSSQSQSYFLTVGAMDDILLPYRKKQWIIEHQSEHNKILDQEMNDYEQEKGTEGSSEYWNESYDEVRKEKRFTHQVFEDVEILLKESDQFSDENLSFFNDTSLDRILEELHDNIFPWFHF